MFDPKKKILESTVNFGNVGMNFEFDCVTLVKKTPHLRIAVQILHRYFWRVTTLICGLVHFK